MERQFPALLLSGDSFHIIFQQAIKIQKALNTKALGESPSDLCDELIEMLLKHKVAYEDVLNEASVQLPYTQQDS